MKKEELYKAFTDIDEDLIEEALEPERERNLQWLWKGLSVSLVFAVCIAVGYNNTNKKLDQTGGNDPIVEIENNTPPTVNNSSSSHLPNDGSEVTYGAATLIVDHYDTTVLNAKDMASAGKVELSNSLTEAMNFYKDNHQNQRVSYLVYVKLFSDEKGSVEDSYEVLLAEFKRLSKQGYTVMLNTIEQQGQKQYYLQLLAYYDQLVSFEGNKQYGYLLLLNGEIFPESINEPVYHGFME